MSTQTSMSFKTFVEYKQAHNLESQVGPFAFTRLDKKSKHFCTFFKAQLLQILKDDFSVAFLRNFHALRSKSSRFGLSLRLIEWFFINYSNTNVIIYKGKNVRQDYKNKVKFYNKGTFDAISRDKTVVFLLDGERLTASVGQLHFFSWVLSNDYDKLILSLVKPLRLHMREHYKKNREIKNTTKKKTNPNKKRRRLTSTPSQSFIILK